VRLSFGEFVIDFDERRLSSSGHEIRLTPKAFDLLRLLIETRPKALSKQEIFDRLWPGTFVTENNLATLVADLRSSLGDQASGPRFIRTVYAQPVVDGGGRIRRPRTPHQVAELSGRHCDFTRRLTRDIARKHRVGDSPVFHGDGRQHRRTPIGAALARLERNGSVGGSVSPDGHWLAFHSDATGRDEVYVCPYPNTESGLRQVTTTGGTHDVWNPKKGSNELFFYKRATKTLMRVLVDATAGANWKASPPEKVLDLSAYNLEDVDRLGSGRQWDVAPDGNRFVITKPLKTGSLDRPQIILVQHLDRELNRGGPAK